MRCIYLDNAASRAPTNEALAVYGEYSRLYYANTAATHALGTRAQAALEEMRERISKCINGGRGTVYFCSGGTEANNLAIIGAVVAKTREGKRGVLTTAIEHSSVLNPLNSLCEQKFGVFFASPRRSGAVSPQDLKMQISGDLSLTSVMYANNVTGVIQRVGEIGQLCKESGVLFHTDAVQAMGHTGIDVERDNIDLLSFSGHKFGGVKGVGGLWVRDGVELEPLLHGGGQEAGLRSGTVDLPGVAAMTVALEQSLASLPTVAERCRRNKRILLQTLHSRKVFGAEIGDGAKLPHILNIAFDGVDGATLQLLLSEAGVMVSTASACSSAQGAENYVLKAMGIPDSLARGSVRISFSGNETDSNIEIAACRIASAVDTLTSKKVTKISNKPYFVTKTE